MVKILSATQDRWVIQLNQLAKSIIRDSYNLFSYKLVKLVDFIISLRAFYRGIEYSLYDIRTLITNLQSLKNIYGDKYITMDDLNTFIITSKINNIFFKYYFKSNQFIRYVNQNLNYRLRDGKSIFYNQASIYQITLPSSIEEQKKIGDFLKAVDDIIARQNNSIEKLKHYKT